MPPEDFRIEAKHHVDPEGSIVRSAQLLADYVLMHRATSCVTVVSLVGLRGLSSSYFNTLLRRLADQLGLEAISQKIRFEYESSLQQQMLDRSLAAMRKEAA